MMTPRSSCPGGEYTPLQGAANIWFNANPHCSSKTLPSSCSDRNQTATINPVSSFRMPNAAIPELATYIAALSSAVGKTRRAEDRSRYRDHLATAALVFERLQEGDLVSAKQLVADERRSFGWDILDGETGASAESAFSRFAEFIERL